MSVTVALLATAAVFALGTLCALALLRGGRVAQLPWLATPRIGPVRADATVVQVPRRPKERDERR